MASHNDQSPTHSKQNSRSERMLREMLQKDGHARSRSLSRSSSSAAGIPQYTLPVVPPLPDESASQHQQHQAHVHVHPTTSATSRPSTVSRNASDSSITSSTEERPLFAANGPGGPGLLFRPTLPSPRKTHDGIIPQKSPPPTLPTQPAQLTRHQTAPPAPLNHTESSPLPNSPYKPTHNVHQPVARPYTHTQLPAWSYEGGESSSPTSYSPHSAPFSNSHNHPLSYMGSPSGSPSGSSSGVSSAQQPCTPSPSAVFDLQSANAFCRQQQGYISFGDIQGLGRPSEFEEDERLERERLEQEQRKKRGFWGWVEEATQASGLVSRPKTPAMVQQAQA